MNRLSVAMVMIVAPLAAGCATTPVVAPPGTIEAGMGRQRFWQPAEGFRWSNYQRVIVEPFILDGAAARSPELAEKLRTEFTGELASASLLTNEPAHGVLRVRIHVTGIDRSRPALNLVTTALLFVPMDMGGASLAAELLDAESGRVVATLTDRSTSTPLKIKGSFSEYGHAEAAFRRWGQELRQSLTQQRIG